jgi:GT2 family glycosyltransferase
VSGRGTILHRPSEGPPPGVSIVVPTHHRPEMLSRLLESFRHLTYPSYRLELIVVGGDHDPGREVVEAFRASVDFPVAYYIVPDDALHSASFKRNAGARSARGDILAFTDDDCVVHPDWITAAVPLFQDAHVGSVEGVVEIPKPDRPTLTYKGSQRLSLPGGYQTCNMLYRKAVFDECGGFDLSFPYYLEDTDLAYTVLERGYAIPFAASAVVSHPVQLGRPLKLLIVARSVEQMPYLFVKHARSKARLEACIRPFNRSHYLYLALYATASLVALIDPVVGVVVLAFGLSILLPVHLAHDLRGVRVTASEFALMALCQPVVPILRLFYWLKGLLAIKLAVRSQGGSAR